MSWASNESESRSRWWTKNMQTCTLCSQPSPPITFGVLFRMANARILVRRASNFYRSSPIFWLLMWVLILHFRQIFWFALIEREREMGTPKLPHYHLVGAAVVHGFSRGFSRRIVRYAPLFQILRRTMPNFQCVVGNGIPFHSQLLSHSVDARLSVRFLCAKQE